MADCDFVQGYYFARPMPLAEFEELFRNGHTAMDQGKMGEEDAREPQPFPVLLVADEDAGYRRSVRETFEGGFRVSRLTVYCPLSVNSLLLMVYTMYQRI